VKAAVAGLRAYPTLNASLDGTNVILHKESTSASRWRSTGACSSGGENADEKNILGIQRNMNDLAERARSKKLKPEEVQESTFSITNPGVFGGCSGCRDQPAQRGYLGLGAIEKRPVVINDSIAIRSMCYVTPATTTASWTVPSPQFLHKVKERWKAGPSRSFKGGVLSYLERGRLVCGSGARSQQTTGWTPQREDRL